MSQLGSPKTNLFEIGTAEVRIGPMSLANKLTQAYTVGLIDDVTVEISQDSVDLEGNFPRRTVDSAIVRQNATITCNAREYSRRNMKVMIGEGIDAVPPVDYVTTLVTNETAGSVEFDVAAAAGANFAAGDIIVVYTDGHPELVSVVRVSSVATDTITLDSGTPLLHDYNGTVDTVRVFQARPVAIGNNQSTNYFTVSVISKNRGKSGRPRIWNFWKASVASGLTFTTNAEDFAGNELQFKALEPAADEYDTGGDLEHLANVIPDHLVGMMVAGGDATA